MHNAGGKLIPGFRAILIFRAQDDINQNGPSQQILWYFEC